MILLKSNKSYTAYAMHLCEDILNTLKYNEKYVSVMLTIVGGMLPIETEAGMGENAFTTE